ncbi:MAG: hydrogenase maturation protease [Anaerolineae bacterium]|nr:hydrogenase maturation protease [Anaerolineae bacterium]
MDDQTPATTLILALGNPLRADDGVGAAVIEALRDHRLPPDVELLDGGTPGLETVLYFEGRSRVIVVDAADMGLEPGEWRRFTLGDATLKSNDMGLRGTLHYAGLAEAIALADAMGALPPELIIFGIQPESIGWEPGLSEPLCAAVDIVAGKVLAEIS